NHAHIFTTGYFSRPSGVLAAFSASMNSYRVLTDIPGRRRPRPFPGTHSSDGAHGLPFPAHATGPARRPSAAALRRRVRPAPGFPRRYALTQLPSVPSTIPSSRATCAIGRDVSITAFTASSRNSAENFFRRSGILPSPFQMWILLGPLSGIFGAPHILCVPALRELDAQCHGEYGG